MSTASQTPSSNATGNFSSHGESGQMEGVLARVPEGLVHSDELPSAAAALAELFPPEENSAPHPPAPSADAPVALAEAETQAKAQAGTEEAAVSLVPAVPAADSRKESLGSVAPDIAGAPSAPAIANEFDPALLALASVEPLELLETFSASAPPHAGLPQGGSASSREALLQEAGLEKDALPDAAAPATKELPADAEISGAGAPENGNHRKKSLFSGLAAASQGLFHKVAALLTVPRRTPSQPADASEAVVRDTQQPEKFAPADSDASLGVPSDGLHPAERSTGAVAADSKAVLDSKFETESLLADFALSLEIPPSLATKDFRANLEAPSAPAEKIQEDVAEEFAGPDQLALSGSADRSPFGSQDAPFSQAGEVPGAQPFEEVNEEGNAETGDVADDDVAIAAAIERFANRNVLALEPAENTAAHGSLSESAAEAADLNSILGIPRDGEPSLPLAESSQPERYAPTEIHAGGFSADALPAANAAPVSAQAAGAVSVSPQSETPAPEVSFHAARAAEPAPKRPLRDWSFEEKLASHHEWIESKGTAGRRIDFAGSDLEGSDLIGAHLRYIDLHDANLRAADLLMADLRDACLVRANFRDSCLVGANLEAANLEGALLETSMGLVPHQLAGANLHGATLPQNILQFDALPEFKRASRTVQGYFVAMMSVSVLSWLTVWMTRDFQLVTNSSILRFLHSPAASAALPAGQVYLIAPFALFILYLVFHFQLQHLWDTVLELPAVFPDGRTLGESEPRIVVGLLRSHFRWMNQEAPATRFIERALSIFLAYWIVPVTLLFYWLRYLTLQEMQGTIFQELLVVGAAGAALYSTGKVGKSSALWTLQQNTEASSLERAFAGLLEIDPVRTALVFLALLTFISAGTMAGVPHGKDRAPQFSAASIRRWASTVLWSFGIDPYADLTEAVISAKPANWNGSDEQVPAVKGARLNDSNFRYAQAYRVFLVNAHLLHSKLQGAFLSQADLRGADLGQSDLRYAILDQAQMNHANLDRAMLDGANLSRSDLRASNLSYASISGASLVDARLNGATLYGAKLFSSTMIRTDFEKADLREAHLNNANLEHADMQGAYLWSAKLPGAHLNNAQLGTAIFVDADLRGADLRWAQLSGTVLTGADLTGAALDGADFRTAVGFGSNQICSARSRKGLLLDEAMQAQVTAQCGAGN